jgi:hypothetical protein
MTDELRKRAEKKARRARKALEHEYQVNDAYGLCLLDRYQAALAEELYCTLVVDLEGIQVDCRGGRKAHPLLSAGRVAREQALRALKQLAFEPPK